MAHGQNLVIEGFTPDHGAEGTEVTVIGQGFAADPLDHWVFVHDGSSRLGTVLEPLDVSQSFWSGVLGPAPEPFVGEMTVWRGARWRLSSQAVEGEAGSYQVKRAEWFVPRRAADGPGLFTVTDLSEKTIGSLELGVAVGVDFSTTENPYRIDLNVTIDGGSSDPGGGEGLAPLHKRQQLQGPASRALSLRVYNSAPSQTATPEALARDMALVLTQIYGGLGVRARAQGSTLYISWNGAPTFERAFAVLNWD